MSYLVRELGYADIKSVQQIDQVAHGQQWSHRTFVDQIEGDDRLHLVIADNGAVVAHGAVWFDATNARVTNVAVAPDRLRGGLGALVMWHLCERARSHVSAQTMSLEVTPTNRAAQALYRSFGFMPVGIERDFYGHGRDSLVMSVPDLRDPIWLDRLRSRTPVAQDPAEGAVA